jgi:putative transposase
MSVTIETVKTIACKNCGSSDVSKFGTYKGVQRYWCKSCQRKFKADDSQFHENKPSQYISSAVNMYYTGMSLNDIRNHLKQEYGYYPSKSVVFKWVNKYTDLARKQFKDSNPKVGDTWIADETMLDIDGEHKVWFYDIIDRDTRFLLASRVALSRTTKEAEMLMRDAEKCAGKKPKAVITDNNYSYVNGIPEAYEGKTEHVLGNPFKTKDTGESTSEIERFHGTLKDRTKIFRAFRDVETLIQFADGWLVYYNYFKPHQSLNGKTPADEAKVDYSIKNWVDLGRVPVSKQSEIQSHKTPKVTIITEKVNMDKAYKRKRGPTPRGPVSLYGKEKKTRSYTKDLGAGVVREGKRQHIELTPHRVPQHFSKRGGGLTRRSDR